MPTSLVPEDEIPFDMNEQEELVKSIRLQALNIIAGAMNDLLVQMGRLWPNDTHICIIVQPMTPTYGERKGCTPLSPFVATTFGTDHDAFMDIAGTLVKMAHTDPEDMLQQHISNSISLN